MAINIIMFNMSSYTDWQQGVANRNGHVLHTLLKDSRVNKIIVVDYLPFTLKRVVKQLWQNVWRGVSGRVLARGWFYKLVQMNAVEINKTGYELPDEIASKLLVYSDIRSWWSERAVYKNLTRLLGDLKIFCPLIWSYLPTAVGYVDNLENSGVVFDAVDNWLEHSSYRCHKQRLMKNYKFLQQRAQVIFTTSPALVEFFGNRDNCMYVPNGVATELCNNTSQLVDKRLAKLSRPLLGYVGIITKDRFDVDLVAYLARHNPQKSFVLVGPVWKNIQSEVNKKLKSLANVHLIGCVPYCEALSIMREFDLGLVPNHANAFNSFTDPLKLYEYLAVGKPVVSIGHVLSSELSEVVYNATSLEDYNMCLQRALVENNQELVEHRQVVAARYSWIAQVNSMLSHIKF